MASSTPVYGNAPAERTHLFLDSVPAPVVATIARRSARRLTVRQALPFLELQGGLRDSQGRRAHIGSVAVEMDGTTPNLVLDVVYDDREDDTTPIGVERWAATCAVAPKAQRNDRKTLVFRTPTLAAGEERVASERIELYSPWRERWSSLRQAIAAWLGQGTRRRTTMRRARPHAS